jgi:hypothetical protein
MHRPRQVAARRSREIRARLTHTPNELSDCVRGASHSAGQPLSPARYRATSDTPGFPRRNGWSQASPGQTRHPTIVLHESYLTIPGHRTTRRPADSRQPGYDLPDYARKGWFPASQDEPLSDCKGLPYKPNRVLAWPFARAPVNLVLDWGVPWIGTDGALTYECIS